MNFTKLVSCGHLVVAYVHLVLALFDFISVCVAYDLAPSNQYQLWSYCFVGSIFSWFHHVIFYLGNKYKVHRDHYSFPFICSFILFAWGSLIFTNVVNNNDATNLFEQSNRYMLLYVCYQIVYWIHTISVAIFLVVLCLTDEKQHQKKSLHRPKFHPDPDVKLPPTVPEEKSVFIYVVPAEVPDQPPPEYI